MHIDRESFTDEEYQAIIERFEKFVRVGNECAEEESVWWDLDTLLEINNKLEIKTVECFEFGEQWIIKKFVQNDRDVFLFENNEEDYENSYLKTFDNLNNVTDYIENRLEEIAQGVLGWNIEYTEHIYKVNTKE